MLDFLKELVDATEEAESPERFWWWSGLASIAAVARKHIFLDRHFYKLYPNIYVAIVSARSGLRKGVPVMVCKSLIEETQKTRVISGCNSIQALIHELSCQKTFERGEVIGEAQGILVSDEFEAFLTEDPRALTYLTALQNTHEHEKGWEKRLKGSPVEQLKSPCLTLLVASNKALFDSTVKLKDTEGGFIARTFMVYESDRRTINSLTRAPKRKVNKDELVQRLVEISKIEGEFAWTEPAIKLYDEWYGKLCRMQIEDRTGSVDRLGDQVLKVAMLISLSKKADLFLKEEDVYEAIQRAESCMSAVSVIGLSGSGEVSEAIASVLKVLIEAPTQTLSRRKILQKLHMKGVDAVLLDRVLESLTQSGAILAMFRDPENKKEIMVRMNPAAYAKYVDYKSVN